MRRLSWMAPALLVGCAAPQVREVREVVVIEREVVVVEPDESNDAELAPCWFDHHHHAPVLCDVVVDFVDEDPPPVSGTIYLTVPGG